MKVKNEIKEVFSAAQLISTENGSNGVGAEHLIKALMEKNSKIKEAFFLSILINEDFEEDLDKKIKEFKLGKGEERISQEVYNIFEGYNESSIVPDVEMLLFDLLGTKKIKAMIKYHKTSKNEILETLNSINKKDQKHALVFEVDPMKENKSSEMPILTDLTKKASEKKITKITGRNEETSKIFQILQRKTKNTPIIVGESGVGKTALIQNLALLMNENLVPDFLRDVKLMEVNKSVLISGTSLQGDLEGKVNELISFVEQQDAKMFLFIDNIGSLSDGKKQDNRTGILEMLLPAIESGRITCIATSTIKEFKFIERDPLLNRIFQKIELEQPTVPETISILRSLKSSFEKHHGVEITDASLVAATKLADRYIMDKCFPDKAIDLIDEAASIVKMEIELTPRKILNVENKLSQKKLELFSISIKTPEDQNEYDFLEKEVAALTENLKKLNMSYNEEKTRKELIDSLNDKMSRTKDVEEQAIIKKELEDISKTFVLICEKVSENEILEVVAQKTNIPVNKITETDKDKVLNLEAKLEKVVIGQSNAVKSVSGVIKRSMAGLASPDRPSGSFLFLGTTGVGKTELSKQLAIELFSSDKDLIRFDMSEFMEKQSVSQLIGSPMGYQGSDEGGVLTEAVKRKPYSIVLFDEIEKAHPDVLNLFLQVLDEGRLTDARGTLVNFKNTIIIMTSNLGSEHIKDSDAFFSERSKRKVFKELEKKLRPEFINRIDNCVIFERLNRDNIEKIAKINLDKLKKRIGLLKIDIEFDQSCLSFLSSLTVDSRYGARPLSRDIKNYIEDNIANYILEGHVKKGDKIIYSMGGKGSPSYEFLE